MKRARSRLLVQAMTFEGDSAGQRVAEAIRGSQAADRRVLVDDYTRVVVSDRFVLSPHTLLSRAFRGEVRATREMFRGLIRHGVRVRTTNPIAGRVARYGVRNHKKLIVADDVAYIGGLNFSDHNFGWHDLMLRIEAPDVAVFLAEDFDATWESRSQFRQADFGDIILLALDGRTNREGFGPLMAAIEGARERIEIVSPYLTFPFVDALGAAVRRGVRVELLTPLPNNKPMVRHYLSHVARRAGLDVRLLPEMTHLKGMLIDGRSLVVGSTNFDFPSYYALEEYIALVEDPELVAAFRTQVLEPLRASVIPGAALRSPPWHVLRSRIILALGGIACRAMGGMERRAIDWRG
ncbi:MAG TPA: phosphatidylserine/phosphatidylglycerophosphate/cardiolipin synthase family protein [Allosphingosinicella sp.]|jgi:cardiolipin synthase|nr:phosphatidylserine/phosphatidylglycerophosphate/cardiolipin synthase family protein [Allosphingosinicella sp.]